MNESLIIGALLLVLIGATTFYLYSRILFNERKLGLIESLLLDIRMNMDMEETKPHGGAPFAPGPMPSAAIVEELPAATELDDVEEYKNVMEEAAAEAVAPTTTVPPQSEDVASMFTRDYDALSREEVALIAEKRGLRVTKRMAKGTIIALLQEADKVVPQQGTTDVSGTPVGSSAGGAPLESKDMEELD